MIVQLTADNTITATVTDTSKLTYSLRGSVCASGNTACVYEYYAKSSSSLSSDTVTLTWGSSLHAVANVFGVAGANFASPFDSQSGLPYKSYGQGSAGSPQTPYVQGVSTSNPDDLIIGLEAHHINTVETAGTLTVGSTSLNFQLVDSQICCNSANSVGSAESLNEAGTFSSGTVTFGSSVADTWAMMVDVLQSNSAVTDVKGSWIVPAVQGCSTPATYSLAWVGIDGWTSSTVEQTGTASNCVGGKLQYYAWYESYPSALKQFSLAITPGDKVTAEVSVSGSRFTATVTDVTTGRTASTTFMVFWAAESSAEWIIEAPSSGTTLLPLSNFRTAYLGSDNTGVTATGYATVGGKTGPIGSFTKVIQLTMVSSANGAVKAQSSPLSSDGTSFTVAWTSAGP